MPAERQRRETQKKSNAKKNIQLFSTIIWALLSLHFKPIQAKLKQNYGKNEINIYKCVRFSFGAMRYCDLLTKLPLKRRKTTKKDSNSQVKLRPEATTV